MKPLEAAMATFERPQLADAPSAVRADIPDWCVPLFERAFGDAWVEEGAALATRPPLDLPGQRGAA